MKKGLLLTILFFLLLTTPVLAKTRVTLMESKTVTTDSSKKTIRYTYNSRGLVKSWSDGREKMKYSYQGRRLVKAGDETFLWEGGKMIQSGKETLRYEQGKLTESSLPSEFYNRTFTYSYRKNGLLKEISYYDRYTRCGLILFGEFTFKYDKNGYLKAILRDRDGGSDRDITYKNSYKDGRLTKRTKLVGGKSKEKRVYTYKTLEIEDKFVETVQKQQQMLMEEMSATSLAAGSIVGYDGD